ncbi:uncharacterized protein [Montipora capricornis]|uniref:uncharacterized protein isoform X2 n=1 Tax=Montipora capricornis TaxID=246305 RepID=UPI0035F129C6
MRLLCFLLLVFVGFLSRNYCRGAFLDQKQKLLSFGQHIKCTYTYELAVHTARGAHSTASNGYQVHALVDVTPMLHEHSGKQLKHLMKLDIREPRLRRVQHGRVLSNHPVNEEFGEQLSKPFYFRQGEHGSITEVLFPKDLESPEIEAFKKGIVGSFQLNLKEAHKFNAFKVQEHDDSGFFRAKYDVLSSNDTHAYIRRTWTNHDYTKFADGTPANGQHKVQSEHRTYVHLENGKVKQVHRSTKASFKPAYGHPRADNFKGFQGQDQDIEMSTSGYSKLTLLSCSKPKHGRAKRSVLEEEYHSTAQSLTSDSLLFTETDKIKWSTIGGERTERMRPLYVVLRCFTDKDMKERDIGDCSNELHRMVKDDKGTFRTIVRLIQDRSHRNLTSWAVYIAALSGHGKYEAQNALAQAVIREYPRSLSKEEYEALLVGIFYLPEGPLHVQLFDALSQLITKEEKGDKVTAIAMLVLTGLTARAERAGYNESLCDSVAQMVHNRYQNKSSLYHPESEEHQTQLRDHIWAFGNLGHLSGLPLILEHINHDNSGIRSAVITAMRKLPAKLTNQHLLRALHADDHHDVKAAVVDIFVERHQNLSDSVVQVLEHAIEAASENGTLDSSIKEFLENHGDHPKAIYLRKKRGIIHRQKRALFPFLRPREFSLGRTKRWGKTFGGEWLGAESIIQFLNQVNLRIGIFGGKFEVKLENFANIRAHILKFNFSVVRGKAAFRASASFKNDFPKDLIHAIPDAGNELLRQFDSITSIIAEQINQFKDKLAGYLPLYIDKFKDFVSKLVEFVQNLVQPLRPINLMSTIIQLAKDVLSRVKDWKWLINKIHKIQLTLGRLTGVDDIFRQVIGALDKILNVVGNITKYLPNNLPGGFNIKNLLDSLRSVSTDLYLDKIREYFSSLGVSIPGGFLGQFPFKFSIRFSLSLQSFQKVSLNLLRFANRFLDISSLLDFLEGIRFPRMQLQEMNARFPPYQGNRFNFGLRFDWRIGLKFNLNLKSANFQSFVAIFKKLSDFLKQFSLPDFNLEMFFQEILPGNSFDLRELFKGLLEGRRNANSTNPSEILQDFLNGLDNLFDFQFKNVSAISDISDFFHELGPSIEQFARQNVQRICSVYELALNSSQEFREFGNNFEREGIQALQVVENSTQNALTEILNFTILVDNLIAELDHNFSLAVKDFIAGSLQELTGKLKDIQDMADDVVDFANGTASKVTGACTKTANFSAVVIDKVQDSAREAVIELASFIGPVATNMKTVGAQMKSAVTNVETWYNENLTARVGKISRVAQIISDFLSILNTKKGKGFLETVREIATRINEVLKHLKNLPEYASKAKKVANDFINFSDHAETYKREIQKLDLGQHLGVDFDQRMRDVCDDFKTIATEILGKIGSYNIAEEVNTFFSTEAHRFALKAVSKFRRIKEPMTEIKGELRNVQSIVRKVIVVLTYLKPFTNNFSPILETAGKLPACGRIKTIFLGSTKPCVQRAFLVGKDTIYQYTDLKKRLKLLYDMVPETWINFKLQKCVKGGTCISKAFIDQAKAVTDKVDFLMSTFQEASGFTDILQRCEEGVNNITAVIDTVKLLIEQARNFSLKDDVKKVKAVFQKITGLKLDEKEEGAGSGIQMRSIKDGKERIERIVDYIRQAKDIKGKMEDVLENTFKAMKNVYDDTVLEHIRVFGDVRSKLQLFYELWQKTKNINHAIQALETITQTASRYSDELKGVTKSFANPIVNLLAETGELSDVVEPHLNKYVSKFTDIVKKVNGILDKITDFLNKLQLRQRDLDLTKYKPWHEIPYCSGEVCLRSIRRSSSLYLDTIFTWKFPHLDDLSSITKSGRWLTPGLFDDYKVEGISKLSNNKVVLGMYGVSSNRGKASLLVVSNLASGVMKIIQLGSQSAPFSVKIGGVAVARDYVWISDSESKNIHSVRKSSIESTFSTKAPSWVGISKTVSVEGKATSVSYDEPSNVLWVTNGDGERAYGYKLSVKGDLVSINLAPYRVIRIGKNAQGMAIVRQFGGEFACISKCAMIAGFQCKLEFHALSSDETGENSLERVVRTPSGLESVNSVDSEVIAAAFSSGTYSEKENIELMGGEFEDRYFYLRLPILKTTFGIHENCLFFKVMNDYVLRPQRLFPFGDMLCGHNRKRSIYQLLLESDVYSDQLEREHRKNRMRRTITDPGSCMTVVRGNLLRGSHQFIPEYSQTVMVFGIPVKLFAGAGGYYVVDFHGQVCMRDKTFRLGLIPGTWVSVYAGASLALFIVEAGITIEAKILETYFVPDLQIKIDKWPLRACIELRLRMTPLRIRVWLWFRFRLCIQIKVWIFGCDIKIGWCSRNTIAEWWWSTRTIDRTLFTNCKEDVDRTPPMAKGSCSARQVSDTKYFLQWHGFHEDTKIDKYHVRIGSIQGSGDDFSAWIEPSLSLVVDDVPIMHGRDVYVSVMATNYRGMDSRIVDCKTVARRKGPQIGYVYDGVIEAEDADYQCDTFTVGMNFQLRSNIQDVVAAKWGVSSNTLCTFDEIEADIVPMTPIGDSTSIQVSGLNLKHGHKYFTRLFVMDSIGFKAVMCSDGILIDTTPPIPGNFQDGAGKQDVQYLPSIRRVRGKFEHFTDPESPIIKYECKVVIISGSDITPFVGIPITQQTPLIDGVSLEVGASYRLVLRGTNAAGLHAVVMTNGFIPDDTPPTCGENVLDVLDERGLRDVDFVRDLNNIQAKWICWDRESNIREQLVGVGTYPSGDDVRTFKSIEFLSHNATQDGMVFVSFTGIKILPTVRYHVTVKVINGANLKRTITSDGIQVDTTPPRVAVQYIKDAEQGRDKNYTSERFNFSAHWEQAFSDKESGLVEYRVGLGTRPGLTDIREFQSVGSQTSVTLSGLLLSSGQRYFVSVMACNGVGMCTNGSSNGAIVDFVPPHTGKIVTGLTGPPVLYQWITKAVWARWNWCSVDERSVPGIFNKSQCSNDSFYDVHSGVANFGISVSSLMTDDLVAPNKMAGKVRSSGRNIDLSDGIYSVVIEAKDRAGVGSRGSSNPFIVDSSPPSVTYIQHGHFGKPQEYSNAKCRTFKSYFEIEDDLSKVASYKVGVGSYAGADDVLNFKTISLSQPVALLRANWTASKSTLLENNRRYYMTVWAINKAGLFSIKSSAPLVSDSEVPKGGIVLDGWGSTDANYQSYSALYRAHWYGFRDFSGIESVYLGLSSKRKSTDCDVKKEEMVSSNADYRVLFGLNLTSGHKYYACLRVVDRAGNVALVQSSGIVVDSTPPNPGFVTDGKPGEDLEVQIESFVLRASWVNFTEHETKIASYRLAFGTSPGGDDAQDFTEVGLVNTAASSKLKVSELISGQRYYATVIAYNVLGMPSAMASSDGVIVDFSPPIFLKPVHDGVDPDNNLKFTSSGYLSASWICTDPETSLYSVEVAFGLQPGESHVMNFTTVPIDSNSLKMRSHLRLGFRYFATVRCTNKVGLKSVTFSDGVIFDTTPPNALYVQHGDYQSSTRNVTVSFKFVDLESSVQEYRVRLWAKNGSTSSADICGSFSFNGNVTTVTLQLAKELKSSGTYFVNVTGVNGVALETTIQSAGFMVDVTPPICLYVWDGVGNYLQDVQYAPSYSKRIVSWICFDLESHVVRFRFSVKNANTEEYIIPFYSLKTQLNSSGSAIITGGGRQTITYEEGQKYTVGVEVLNAVGLTTIHWTNGVLIDSTPPVVNNLKLMFDPKNDSLRAEWTVSDDESGVNSVAWGLGTLPDKNDIKNFTSVPLFETSLRITNVSLKLGRTHFFRLLAINNAGLPSTTSSNGVVIDRTAPNPGVVSAQYVFPPNYDRTKNEVPGSMLVVTWTGFTDSESGVKSTSWAVGPDPQVMKENAGNVYNEVVTSDSVGGAVIENQTLIGNKTYFVCVRATNGAGLDRTDCSPGLVIVLGKFIPGVVSDGPVISAIDIDFQLDDKAIWAHWHGFKDPVYDISRYDWCIRDQPPNPSGPDLCKWPYTEINHLRLAANRFHNLTLEHGRKYYVTIRAENSQGEHVRSSSDGVVVDRTPPVGKSIQIAPATGKGTLYVTSQSAPVVTWSVHDPESGMGHFLICVGSFAYQDDLLVFQEIDSLSRSLDLDQVNFTLREGLTFFVTVTGVNMLGLKTALTSQQVVVDWTPPISGDVVDGNSTSLLSGDFIDADYQNDRGVLTAHWTGFQDLESSVVEYNWCIGTAQGTCDVKEMTFAGLETSANHQTVLQEGQRYFFTVEATNAAGLKESAYSDGMTVDVTPPLIGDVLYDLQADAANIVFLSSQSESERTRRSVDVFSSLGLCTHAEQSSCYVQQSSPRRLAFSWTRAMDVESGVSLVQWCAGRGPQLCDIVSWKIVDPKATSVVYSLSNPLSPGNIVYVTIRAINGAQMVSTASSNPLLIDSSAPTIGTIVVGNTHGMKHIIDNEAVLAERSGFSDVESGLSHLEWSACHASSPNECITPFVNTGLKTTLQNSDLDLQPGISYVLHVRAHNNVGLYSETISNPFTFDGVVPTAGTVYDGLSELTDLEKQSSVSEVSANWSPFSDANSRIAEYEMCVGTEQEKCDVNGFVNLGIVLKGIISGLTLNHTGRYFVTVKATNEAGYSTMASSNGIEVDSTPPYRGLVRDGKTAPDIDFQADDTYIYANWDDFHDEESDIIKYTWCVGATKGTCDITFETDVGDRTSVGQQIRPALATGMVVFVTVGAYNGAGAVTRESSDGVKVDSTAPLLSQVFDLQLNDSASVDKDYITAKDTFCASWDAVDDESGVTKSEISICSAININDCLLLNLDVGNHNMICIADLEFKEGVKYVTQVRSTNSVGRSSEMLSDGFVVDSTVPSIGEIIHVENPPSEDGGQIFTSSKISVEWSGFLDQESGVRNYYLCVGTQPSLCNVVNFTNIENSTSYTQSDLLLKQDETYFVTLKAENGAGLTSDATSSTGVAVDVTAPTNGGQILDGLKQGEDIDFQQSRTEISAHWTAFEDLESDVVQITWCLGSSPGSCDLVEETSLTPTSTSVLQVLAQPIKNGQRFFVTVNATNNAGLTASITSNGVTVDNTPSISGSVIAGIGLDVDFLDGEADVNGRWFGFEDLESGIESYEVALCDARNSSWCPQPFCRIGQATNINITGLDLESGAQYLIIVKAINFAGLVAEASSDCFTVDFTPPTASQARLGSGAELVEHQSDLTKLTVSWSPFIEPESGISHYQVCISTTPDNCSITPFINVGLNTSVTVSPLQLLHGESYYAVVQGTNHVGLSSETTSNGILIDSTPPSFRESDNLSFNSTQVPGITTENLNYSVSRREQEFAGDSIKTSSRVRLSCSEELLTSSWDEFKDIESKLERYDWCVGTSKAHCDVLNLKSVGLKPKGAAIVKRRAMGTLLYATVFAVNGAGLETRVVSEQCRVISVAPKILEVTDIPSVNSSDLTDIDWQSMMQSLSLRWEIIGQAINDISRLRIEVAVTQSSSNISVPQLLSEKSWNGEPIVHNFMDVLSWHRNVTIRSVPTEPWEHYRGVVRVWNEGGIYTEAASNGLRIEPTAPPKRSLKLYDMAAEQEHLRWLPNLRLPEVKSSALDDDVKYVSSPTDVKVIITGSSNQTSNRTAFLVDHNLFSPSVELKIILQRVTSDKNESNTTEDSSIMRVLPGFADPDGPCCAKCPVDQQTVFTDTHFKTTLPSERFGASLVHLPNDYFAVSSAERAFALPLKNRSAKHITMQDDIRSSIEKPIKVVSHRNHTVFSSNGEAHLYMSSADSRSDIQLTKNAVFTKCKNVSVAACHTDDTWADVLSQVISISRNVLTITATNLTTNASVVGIFQKNNEVWKFVNALGADKRNPNFGSSLSLNEHLLAVVEGEKKNSCISVYFVHSTSLMQTICFDENQNFTGPLSIYLTETNALVVVSKDSRSTKILQLNATTQSYHEECSFLAVAPYEFLSGSLDVNARDGGFVAALGMQTLEGRDGVQLFGFQGIYTKYEEGQCVKLGRVISRESGPRMDDGLPRASVSFSENTILFGTPSVLTWPGQGEAFGTGRVYMATYCPIDHYRVRVSQVNGFGSAKCVPCKEGRKSFGGFVDMCSSCQEMSCSVPQSDDPFSLTSSICDSVSCVSTSTVDNETNGLDIHLLYDSFFIPGAENLYTVVFLETTRADQSTRSLSDSFIIDLTAPEVGIVYDGIGSDPNTNCSENTTFSEDSQCSTRSFKDTDIDFTNDTHEIHARWIDFLDSESDIVEYFWCVGTQPMRDDIRVCESTGMRPNGSHYGLTLHHGDSYYITVVACNGARRCSATHSDGVTIDTTPPVMEFVRDGIMGPDIDFQVFVDIIFAYFAAKDPDSDVTSYEVAWGTSPGLNDVNEFEEVTNTTIWLAKFNDNALGVGEKYFATVRATNGAGLLSEKLSSNGIVVGKSEYVFDNESSASFFFDTVNVNEDGSRKDGGIGQTYGTLSVPQGAVEAEVKLRSFSLDDDTLNQNETEEGPVSNPKVTKPKQFMLGNYSFVIKALDPVNNTIQEGFTFAKPITISMFYDVDSLVKANKKHANNEVTKEDVDPVLYLWDPKNETWTDAALTCPEPWSHVNRSIKLLTVNVCHLTQFAFLWSFKAQHGLLILDKNSSIYNKEGVVEVSRTRQVSKLAIPVRRAKGSQGDITIQWSLYRNDSSHGPDLLWPTSGKISLADGEWNKSLIVNLDNDEKDAPQSVVWVQLDKTTGGALLGSRDQTTAKVLIAGKEREEIWHWIVTGVSVLIALILIILLVAWRQRRKKVKSQRMDVHRSTEREEHPRRIAMTTITGFVKLNTGGLDSDAQGTQFPLPGSPDIPLMTRCDSDESMPDEDSDHGNRAAKRVASKRKNPGRLHMKSYRLAPRFEGTGASSDDELEHETSFTTIGTYKPTLHFPCAAGSDLKVVSSEEEDFDNISVGERKKLRSSKTEEFRKREETHDTSDWTDDDGEVVSDTFMPVAHVKESSHTSDNA